MPGRARGIGGGGVVGRARALSLWLATLVLGACVSRAPVDPRRALLHEPDASIPWPALEASGDATLSPEGPGPHAIVIVGHGVDEKQLINHAALVHATIADRRRTDAGVLLDLSIQWRARGPNYTPTPTRSLQFRFPSPSLRSEFARSGQALDASAEAWGDEPVDSVYFGMLEPLGGREPRGLIVCFHSLGGLGYERAVLYELQRRGWMLVVAEFPWGAAASSTWDVQPATAESVGKTLAAGIDARLLRAAIAAEAACAYLRDTTPALVGTPTLVWGASAGSFAAPAVARRLHANALVLVGSGANILDVAQKSTFFNGGIVLRPSGVRGRDTPALVDRVIEAYRDHAGLDPYAQAPYLVRVPTLMIHAGEDEIVPAREGDLLWDRLGKPERWTLSCGHEMLFWRLGSLAQDIADWVDRLLAPPGPRAP